MMRRLSVVLLLFVTLAIATPAIHLRTSAAQLDPAIRDRVTAAAMLVAAPIVWTENGVESLAPMPLGSGTIITADGLALTNYHVVDPIGINEHLAAWQWQLSQGRPNVSLQRAGSDFVLLGSEGDFPPRPRYFASLIAADQDRDIAVLRITAHAESARFREPIATDLPFVSLGNSDEVHLGDRVQILGYPAIGGGSLTYTVGAISGFGFNEVTGEREWISTDAVLSGGSSGGTAISDEGLLIGIPTAGSSLDCRPGDTNRDGVIDERDVGCIPTGGSLGMLVPINMAVTLLEQSGIHLPSGNRSETTQIIPSLSSGEQGGPTPLPRPDQSPPSTGSALVPSHPSVAGPTSCAFAFDRSFKSEGSIRPFNEVDRYGYADNGLHLGIKSPGATILYVFDDCRTNGAPASFTMQVDETSGWGELMILVQAEDGSEWVFNINPMAETWSLYRINEETGQFFYWIEPISYAEKQLEPINAIRIFAIRDTISLLINETNIASSAGGQIPPMTGSLVFGFGIGMYPNNVSSFSQPFEATIERVTLSDLRHPDN